MREILISIVYLIMISTMSTACFICFWHAVFNDWVDSEYIILPLASMAATYLGMLLVFDLIEDEDEEN